MKIVSSFMSFFGKKKIHVDEIEPEMSVNLHKKVKLKPAPIASLSSEIDNTCFILGEDDDPSYIHEMINPPAVIKLSPDKKMPAIARSTNDHMNYLDIRFFSGVFAFLIFKNASNHQFLTIKRLDNYESNHSVLCLFAKRGRFGEELKIAKVVCGGEIVLNHGVIEQWNLKSGGYSQNNAFDEYKNPNIQGSIASLWLPMQNRFKSIKDNDEHLKEKYSPKGSFRMASKFFKPSSDKTVETIFDHDYRLANKERQSTLTYNERGALVT